MRTLVAWTFEERGNMQRARTDAYNAAMKEFADKSGALTATAALAATAFRSEHKLMVAAENDAVTLERLLTNARNAAKELEDLTAQKAALEAERIEIQKKLQEIVVSETTDTLEAEASAIKAKRQEAQTAVTEHDRIRGFSGQVEEAALQAAISSKRAEVLKAVVDKFQEWRDEDARTVIGRIVGPFEERLKLLMGDDAIVSMRSDGAGKSTVFEFMVERHGVPVRLEHLSGEESLLAAMAFLSALQSNKTGPGTILTMDIEALSVAGAARALRALPKLGFDFVMVSANRITSGAVVDAGVADDWQVVELGAK